MTQQDKDQIVRLLKMRWSSTRIPELAQGVHDAIEIVEAMPVDSGANRESVTRLVEMIRERIHEDGSTPKTGYGSPFFAEIRKAADEVVA